MVTSEIISFPGVGLEVKINRVAFHLGSIPVYWYGVLLASGLLAGMIFAFVYAKKVGVDPDRLVDVLFGGVIGGIVGARLYFVAFSWENFSGNLMNIFNIRSGGVAIYGAIIGGVGVGYLMCRWRKVKVPPMFDLTAGGLFIGQAIGRWGNFINAEAFGTNTESIFGMTSVSIQQSLQVMQRAGMDINPSLPVHPTFLYESVWCFLGFLIVVFYFMKKRRFDGEAFLFYLAWYGVERAVVEGLRTDSLYMGSLRVSQVLSVILVVVALGLWYKILSDMKKNGEQHRLYVLTEEGQQVVAGTFYKKEKGKSTTEPTAEETNETTLAEEAGVTETEINPETETAEELSSKSSSISDSESSDASSSGDSSGSDLSSGSSEEKTEE